MGTSFALTGIFIQLATCILDKGLPEGNEDVLWKEWLIEDK